LKPDGQISKTGVAAEAGLVGSEIGIHDPWPSDSNPDAHEVNALSIGTQFPSPFD